MPVNQGVLPARMSRGARERIFQTAMHACNDRDDRRRTQHEVAARAALELRAGRAFADAEWVAMRARLLEFAGILRAWDRETTVNRRGNVEGLCQREP
jgi:hypothetical protein